MLIKWPTHGELRTSRSHRQPVTSNVLPESRKARKTARPSNDTWRRTYAGYCLSTIPESSSISTWNTVRRAYCGSAHISRYDYEFQVDRLSGKHAVAHK